MKNIPENSHLIENLFPIYRRFIMVGYQFNSDAKRTVSVSLYSKKVDCLLINQAELRTTKQLRELLSPKKLIEMGRNHLHPNRVCIVIFNKGVNHNGQL